MSLASIPSAPADLELIVQLKSKLQHAELRIRVLEERLRLLRIEKYGAGGEKLSQAQMQLFEFAPVVSEMIEQAESEHAPVPRSTKKSVKHPGRQELPANLPRVERILPCALDQRVCKRCGKETVVIGYEESSQLDVEPAKYFVLATKREKRACRSCEDLGVVSAPLPPRIIEKCLASDRIVIETVIGKYCNHTPLHRQSMILERDLDLEISRATLDGWVLKVGELLIPMVAAMRRELINGPYIQADETPVDVQMHEGRGQNHQGYLWQYSRPGGTVVFDFRLSRGRDGPKRFLGQFEGILQTDGYAAYDQIGGTRMVHAACWAHARRQFFEAVQLNPRDPVATPIVALMDDLFAIDAEARGKALGIAERHVRRQEAARAILDDIRSKIDAAQSIAEAHALLGISRIRAKYQSGGEFDASRSSGPEELDPHWQSTGRTEGCSDSVCRGKLPQAESPGAGLLFRDSTRTCRSTDQVPPGPYSRCVARAAFTDPSDGGPA